MKGSGFLRQPANTPPGVPIYYYYVSFPVEGTVSGGTADLRLGIEPQPQGFPPQFSRLSGRLTDAQLVGVLEYTNMNEYSVTLRHSRPATTDVAGTWVLSSTTGGPPNATADTIIAAADGRAWQHRDGPLLRGGGFASTAMWEAEWQLVHSPITSWFPTERTPSSSPRVSCNAPTEQPRSTSRKSRPRASCPDQVSALFGCRHARRA